MQTRYHWPPQALILAWTALLWGIASWSGCTGGVANQPDTAGQSDGGTLVDQRNQTDGGTSRDGAQGVDQSPDTATKEPGAPDTTGQDATPPDTNPTDANKPDNSPADNPVTPDQSGGVIQIYLKGDLTPQTFNDGFSGQTPTDYQIAISRYHALRSAQDPSPQLCFDHKNQPAIADMQKDNLVGSCPTQTLQSGTYTHGKVKVDWLRYTVDGTLHYLNQPLPGKFTFFRAYSKTTYQGKTYNPGQGWIRFAGVTTVDIPYQFPTQPQIPGIIIQLVNDELTMTFPFTKPLPVDQSNTQRHWARFHWRIADAFRWADKTLPSYQSGIWDVSTMPALAEEVKVYGVNGYFITTSID